MAKKKKPQVEPEPLPSEEVVTAEDTKRIADVLASEEVRLREAIPPTERELEERAALHLESARKHEAAEAEATMEREKEAKREVEDAKKKSTDALALVKDFLDMQFVRLTSQLRHTMDNPAECKRLAHQGAGYTAFLLLSDISSQVNRMAPRFDSTELPKVR